jgi:hypothetical protein
MGAFIKLLIGTVVIIPIIGVLSVINGWVLSVLWGWFIVPVFCFQN